MDDIYPIGPSLDISGSSMLEVVSDVGWVTAVLAKIAFRSDGWVGVNYFGAVITLSY